MPAARPKPKRKRGGLLERLFDERSICVWLIDTDGQVVFVSDAMKIRLEIEGELPESIAEVLRPPIKLFSVNGVQRGHQSSRIELPFGGGSESHYAHWVRLDRDSLTLGCVGEFVSDADVPWDVWFGRDGVRGASIVAEQIAIMRADRSQRSMRLLAGKTAVSRRFRNRVDLACRVREHLAIIAAPGGGGSNLAAFIHQESQRNASRPDAAYVQLDASLMDSELLEVYASAAITPLFDAVETTTTLCLDRFDEMPKDGQDRLWQWVQTWPKRLRLIGLLSDSVGDPDKRSAEQPPGRRLRSELVDSMSVLPIEIPDLNSRRGDLALIAQSLVGSTRLSREAIELIETYPWPGQWDEMLAAMRFAEDVVRGDRITREHFPLAMRSFRPQKQSSSDLISDDSRITIRPAVPPTSAFQISSLDETLQAYESELIDKAMIASGGNKAEAARRLGISRARLLRKLDP